MGKISFQINSGVLSIGHVPGTVLGALAVGTWSVSQKPTAHRWNGSENQSKVKTIKVQIQDVIFIECLLGTKHFVYKRSENTGENSIKFPISWRGGTFREAASHVQGHTAVGVDLAFPSVPRISTLDAQTGALSRSFSARHCATWWGF